MKRILFILAVFVVFDAKLIAQSSTPAPTPNNTQPQRSNSREINDSFDRLRGLELNTTAGASKDSLIEIEELFYRKPGKKETKALDPSKNLLEKYADFLKQPDVGIVKLNGNSDCAENSNVVVAEESCLQYAFPGAGTAYSFRTKSYRIPHLADLILSNEVLKTDGVLQQGIMVVLPNTSIENVTLETKGMKYLVNFKPAENVEQVKEYNDALVEGIESDGFLYRLGFYAKEQETFALRSIAYKGKIIRSFRGISFNELNFDKRSDVIVAFQIVERDSAGNITIVWKKLSQNDTPQMKIDKTDEK